MGLDQYAHARLPKSLQVIKEEPTQLAYWRKHNALQGWMESLWRDGGGEGDFNCVDVYLTLDDINDLEAAVTRDNLPETGVSSMEATLASMSIKKRILLNSLRMPRLQSNKV